MNHKIPLQTSIQDYSPFGMLMPGRSYSATSNGGYRFGFNDQEKDDEAKGNGNSIDFQERIFDSRLGRWLSIDPLVKKYAGMSCYSFVDGSPIIFVDANGREIIAPDAKTQALVLSTVSYAFGTNNGFSFKDNKLVFDGTMPSTFDDKQKLLFKYFNDVLINSKNQVTIYTDKRSVGVKFEDRDAILQENKGGGVTYNVPPAWINSGGDKIPLEGNRNYILLSPDLIASGAINLETDKGIQAAPPELALWHEFGHAITNILATPEFNNKYNGNDFSSLSGQSRNDWSIKFENLVRTIRKLPMDTGKGQHFDNTPRTLTPISQ